MILRIILFSLGIQILLRIEKLSGGNIFYGKDSNSDMNDGNIKFGKVIFIWEFKFWYDFNKTFAPNMKFPEGR